MLILNICFIKFNHCHQKLRDWKNLHYLENRGSHHRIQRIREHYCKNFKLLSTKKWNFVFFARRQITGSCLFVCLFFFQGSSYRPSGPRMSQEGSFERKWKVLVPFLSDQKIGGHLDPLPRSFFPKSTDHNFENAILFSIVENYNNYKLQTLTSVYIQ